jgi:hypothetical protein
MLCNASETHFPKSYEGGMAKGTRLCPNALLWSFLCSERGNRKGGEPN